MDDFLAARPPKGQTRRSMKRPLFVLVACVAAFVVAGCASSPAPEAKPAPRAADAEPTASADAPKPKRPVAAGTVRREDVLGVLSDGVPAFLGKVEVEPVTDRGGRFLGWRIVAIHDAELAAGDLKAGDVVTRLNGRRIENPLEFYDAFQSLAFARELRIDAERGGSPLTLRYPISDDPNGSPVPRPEETPKAAASAPKPGASKQ